MNGTCTNTAGSFECVCNDGYFGDGRNCSGSHPDPEIIKGPISSKFFRPFGRQFCLKIRGGGGASRAFLLDPSLSSVSGKYKWLKMGRYILFKDQKG